MKNRNSVFPAILFALAFALAPMVQATSRPDGGPTYALPNNSVADAASSEDVKLPYITIHTAGDIARGKTGSFVLDMKPPLMFGGMFVNFSVSGTAIPGVDYVPLVSPAYIGQAGYGVILVQTLPDPRASSFRQAYSVVVTLETGAGYAIGAPGSATLWIKP
jgi:hypothetical protein